MPDVDVPDQVPGGVYHWDGLFRWDGLVNGPDGQPRSLEPGDYELELQLMRDEDLYEGADDPPFGRSGRHPFQVYRLDLDVDTNRDGVIDDDDEAGEDDWTKSRGAYFTVNYDRDGVRTAGGLPISDSIHFDDLGAPKHENKIIDNLSDVQDITPFVVRGLGISRVPSAYRVFLKAGSLADIKAVHVFVEVETGKAAPWGGLTETQQEYDITDLVDPSKSTYLAKLDADGQRIEDLTFGLEGLFFRSVGTAGAPARNPFDGEIDLTLELRKGATVVAADSVRMKVAPWVMLPHTQPSEQVWVQAPQSLFFTGLGDPSQVRTVATSTQWIQDQIEVGYYQRPGGPVVRTAFRLPYGNQPRWPQDRLLSGTFATFQLGSNLGGGPGDFGGNLELIPPTSAFPLGRIVLGNSSSATLRDFLADQEVQGPLVTPPTRWLVVGHIDEVIGFTGDGTDVVVASPIRAYELMASIPAADRARHVFFATGDALPETGIVTAQSPAGSDRLWTGAVNHFAATDWKYVRIYSGSVAAGQVAHISGRGQDSNGYYLEVDKVWDIPRKLVRDPDNHSAPCLYRCLPVDYTEHEAPNRETWYPNRAPSPGDQFVLVENTRFWYDVSNPGHHGTPAFITVQEVLADSDLDEMNTQHIDYIIEGIKDDLRDGLPPGSLSFIPVPVIYFGQPRPDGEQLHFLTDESVVAMTPGLSNFQVVNRQRFFPRQYGPRAASDDLFEQDVVTNVPAALFIDDWDHYHRRLGEVHCGSAVVRTPYASWWSQQ